MLLAIDIGNTNIVFGIYDGGDWKNIWRIQTDPSKTADEYEVIFRTLFTGGQISKNDIDRIILSSVVPALNREFEAMLINYIRVKPRLLTPDCFSRLPLRILNPYEIGSDLVANAMAAYSRFKRHCMVIDFGTALTFITVAADGAILGVAIAPGLRTAIRSLSGSTAQLPDVQPVMPPSALGTNTVHAIQAGIVIGYTGLVDRIISRTEEQLNTRLQVIATGGLSSVFAHEHTRIEFVDENLTLDGLELISRLIC
ncbi:MAG: type III pantothenate kinase [Mangrovibacterium sp.]